MPQFGKAPVVEPGLNAIVQPRSLRAGRTVASVFIDASEPLLLLRVLLVAPLLMLLLDVSALGVRWPLDGVAVESVDEVLGEADMLGEVDGVTGDVVAESVLGEVDVLGEVEGVLGDVVVVVVVVSDGLVVVVVDGCGRVLCDELVELEPVELSVVDWANT